MHGDQAYALRELVKRASDNPRVPRARQIVVAGGCAGVGSTSVACGLAAAYADQGLRALLVDAAQNAHATEYLKVSSRLALPDVIRDVSVAAEALQPGPGGAFLLPNHAVPRDVSPTALQEFAQAAPDALNELATGFDVIITDCGNALRPVWGTLWANADHVLVVSGQADDTIMGAYAAIKTHKTSSCRDLRVLINGAETRQVAESVWRRVANAAQRFLGVSPGFAGYIPLAAEGSSADALLPDLHAHATARLCLRRIISDLEEPQAQPAESHVTQPSSSATTAQIAE